MSSARVEQLVLCASATRRDDGLWALEGAGLDVIEVTSLPAPLPFKVYLSAVLDEHGDREVSSMSISLTEPGDDGKTYDVPISVLGTGDTTKDAVPGRYRDLIDADWTTDRAGVHLLAVRIAGQLMALATIEVRLAP